MISRLLNHQWKESVRSPLWQKQVIVNVIIGFFIIYMLINFLVLGFFLDKMLMEIFDEDPVLIFNSGLLYYFLIDLIFRLYFQELPVMSIQPYLHLPVRKSKLVHYMLGKSLLSIFNFLPLIILVPFAIKADEYDYAGTPVFLWFLSIFLFIISNNYITAYIKRLTSYKPSLALIAIFVVAAFVGLDYLEVFSISTVSQNIFYPFLARPYLIFIPLAMFTLFYFLNYRLLLSHTYLEDLDKRKSKTITATGDFPILRKFGQAGQLIGLQIRLIMRHKRPKSVLYMSAIFIVYPLIFYTNEEMLGSSALMIFVGIFASGMFMLNYGQFLLSWESGYFDSILVQNVSYYEYFRSKYILFIASCLAAYLLTIPYAFFGMRMLYFQTAMFFYNIGISSFVVLFFATIDPKKIDLNRSSAFNWQGVSAYQFLLMMPIMFLPMIIYAPFALMGYEPVVGLSVITAISFINFAFHKFWLKKFAQRLQARKYKLAANFRDQ